MAEAGQEETPPKTLAIDRSVCRAISRHGDELLLLQLRCMTMERLKSMLSSSSILLLADVVAWSSGMPSSSLWYKAKESRTVFFPNWQGHSSSEAVLSVEALEEEKNFIVTAVVVVS